MTHARELGLELPSAHYFQAFAGKGTQAQVDGREVLLGTRALLGNYGIALNELVGRADSLAQSGATPCSSRWMAVRLVPSWWLTRSGRSRATLSTNCRRSVWIHGC
jgi:cation transport ATPase